VNVRRKAGRVLEETASVSGSASGKVKRQAERRLERSRNATTAAVPLTEANATAFSISVRDERALRRSGTRVGRGGRHLRYALHFHFVRKSHRHRIFFRQTYVVKKSLSFPIAPRVAQFARTNVPSFCLIHRTSLPGSNSVDTNACGNKLQERLKSPDGRGRSAA
jgi:hypothetical protein